jgi:hypothetical protein
VRNSFFTLQLSQLRWLRPSPPPFIALNSLWALLFVFVASACNPVGQTTIGQNFFPGVNLSPSNSTVTVSSAQVFSGNSTNVTVFLKDTNDAPFVSNLPTVNLQTNGGTSTGTFGSLTNNGDGSYSASFTGSSAGTATTVQAIVNGSVLTSYLPTITVASGNYSLSSSVITVSSSTVASGSSVNVTLTVKDALGNQSSSGGLNVAFSNSGGSSTGTFSAANDLNNGTYTATFTGDVSGSATAIGATIQGNAVTSSLPNVTVTQGSPANIAVLSGSGQSATAGSAVSSPLIAVVTDSDSNPTPGVTVSWLVTTGGGSVSSCSATTNGAGQAQCNFTTGITAGTNTITASVAGVATPAAFTESGSFGTAASIAVLSGNGQSGTAGSAVSSPLVALVTDSNSNPVAGASVNWTVTAGGGSVSSCSTTNGSGLSQCTLTTGPSVGTNTITASVAGVSTPATFTETTTAGAAASIAVLSGSGQSGTAGSLLSGTLIAVVKDANSNAVSGVTVAWAATAGGGALSSCATTTNISGQTQCRLTTGTIAGTNTVTASVSGISTPATFTETATAGTAASISVSSGGGQSAVAGAADSSPLVAVVKDSNSNVVSGVTVTWAVTAGGGAVSSCTTTTNGLGQVQCNLTTGTTVGTNTVTASVSGIGAPATFTQTTTVGAAASINVSSGGGQTGTAGSPLSGSLIAIVKDSNSNIISGVTVTWAVTAGGGSLSSCTTSTNGSGQVQCNFTTGTTVGTNTATATVSGVATPATFTETTTAGAATSIAVSSGGGQTGTAGAPLPGTLIAVVKDTNSNLVSGVTVTWAVTAGGGSLSSCTTSTNSSGLAQCTFTTGNTVGTNTATATATGVATPATFTETGAVGPAANIVATSGSAQSANDGVALTNPLIATVTDTHGNIVTGATVAWAVTNGNGATSACTTTTNGSGQVQCTFTLGKGEPTTSNTITATAGGIATPATFTETGSSVSFNNSWTFLSANASQFTYSTSKIDLSNGYAELTPSSQTDSSDVTAGFAGGSSTGSYALWDGTNNYMRLEHTSDSGAVNASDVELNSDWTPAWSNLVAYWKLDESSGATRVFDSGPVGTHSGTPQGSLTFGAPGKLGNAVSGFGTNNYIITTATMPSGAYTKSAWVNWNGSGSYPNILSCDNNANCNAAFYINGGVLCGFHNGAYACSSTTFPTNTWVHVAITFDPSVASGTMITYMNGIKQGSATGVPTQTSASVLDIGGWSSNGGYNFSGSLDDLAIWNTALSASAIATIYQHESSKYAGTFTSRVMDGLENTATWSSLAWTPTLPFGKELPDGGTSESSSNYSSQTASLMSGIVGLWHLDEPAGTSGAGSIIDHSGNGHNGTPNGGISFGTAGKLGTAASFGTTTGYVDLGTGVNPANGNNLTFSAWVFGSNTASNNMIIAKGNDATSNSYALNYCNGAAIFELFIGGSLHSVASAVLTTTQWHLITGTINGNTLSVYVDGQFSASNTFTGTVATSTQSLWIGAQNRSGYNYAYNSGSIDEVAAWSRALSSAEIFELYRRGANRIKYQIQTCSAAASCTSSPNWLGPDGTNQTYFTELNNNTVQNAGGDLSASDSVSTTLPTPTFTSFPSLTVPTNEFVQYRAIMESDDPSTNCNYGSGVTWCSPELKSVSVGPTHYDTSSPTITNNTGMSFATLTSLIQNPTSSNCGTGTVYDISPDNSTWYWWNGSLWTAADGTTSAKANLASVITTNMSSFPTPAAGGTFYFKAFLPSTGTSSCVLNSLQLNAAY